MRQGTELEDWSRVFPGGSHVFRFTMPPWLFLLQSQKDLHLRTWVEWFRLRSQLCQIATVIIWLCYLGVGHVYARLQSLYNCVAKFLFKGFTFSDFLVAMTTKWIIGYSYETLRSNPCPGWKKRKLHYSLLIPNGNSYCRRKSSARGLRCKVSSEGLSAAEIDIPLRSPIQVQAKADN